MKSHEGIENESQALQLGLFASFPSKTRNGYFAQAFFVLPGILVGYLIMSSAWLFFAVDLDRIGVLVLWIVFLSFCIVRELVAAVAPEVFDLVVRRSKRDTIVIIGAYLLGIIAAMIVQAFLPIKESWNLLVVMSLTFASIYLPCILFGSAELRKAILPAKRRVPNT